MAEPTRVRSAGVQCLGGEPRQLEVNTGGVAQHITPNTGEVLILPFAIAKFLVQNRPSGWQPLIIVPNIVATGVDVTTGLDTLDVAISTVWGITQGGTLYWDDTGVDGADVAKVTYSSGFATFDGGYGQSVAKPMLQRTLPTGRVWWQEAGYRRVDVTVTLDHQGNAARWIDIPKSELRSLSKVSDLSVFSHPDAVLSWQEHQGGTMIYVEGATGVVHPDPPQSIVVTYWHKAL